MDTKIDDKQLEQDVIRAIRARGLREQMENWANEARREQEKKQTIRPLPVVSSSKPWPRVRRVLTPIAVAAMLCGVIWMTVPTSTWNAGYRMAQREYARHFSKKKTPVYQNSNEALLALAKPDIKEIAERSNTSYALGHDDPVFEAATLMSAGHYRAAQSALDEVMSTIGESNPRYSEIMDDIDYLNALCDLGRGRRTRAYNQLKTISTSGSRHAAQAAELVKHFK